MTDSCKYHPKVGASWLCQACETNFCSACMPIKEVSSGYPKCTLCRRTLVRLSIADKIPPFWKKLPRLLSIPFSSKAQWIILFFALIFSLLPSGKVGLVLVLIALVPLVDFMFNCMEQVASGEKLQLKLTNYLSLANKSNLIKLLSTYFLVVMLIVEVHVYSTVLSFFVMAFFVASMPASLIILMMEKSMLAMINPAKIIYMIKLFGSAYWLLYVMVLFVAILTFNFNPIAQGSPLPLLSGIIVYGLTLYFMTSVFIMAGYLVFQYHFELNFTINSENFYQNESLKNSNSLSEVNIFIQEGRYEDAQTLLLEQINNDKLNYKANEKLILLYSIQDKNYHLNKLVSKYLLDLVNSGKSKHAADFYCKLKKRNIDIEMDSTKPDSSELVLSICIEMQNKIQYKYALELIEASIEKVAMPKSWEELYFIHAKMLAEFANKIPEAVNVLNYIIKRSFNQTISSEAEVYLKSINQ